MIFEESCGTEDWSNDAEKSALPSQAKKNTFLKYIKTEINYFKL